MMSESRKAKTRPEYRNKVLYNGKCDLSKRPMRVEAFNGGLSFYDGDEVVLWITTDRFATIAKRVAAHQFQK